jgi:serine/threonine protein phosphatase PrpC
MRCFSLQQASNVRCEDVIITHRFEEFECDLFAVFDGTSWHGVHETGGFEVAQEVLVAFPRLLSAEFMKVPQLRPQQEVLSQGSKRARPPSEVLHHNAILKAMHRAVVALDDHLFAFEGPKGERIGLESGGSLIALVCHKGKVFSIVVGDCEGAAFHNGVELKLSCWPHNINFTKEVNINFFDTWILFLSFCFMLDGARKAGVWSDFARLFLLGRSAKDFLFA